MKCILVSLAVAGVLCAAAPALSAGPGSVGVEKWRPGEHGSAETVTVEEPRVDKVRVDGEDIYLNGVLQKEKYVPGARIELKDGHVLVIPGDSPTPFGDSPKAPR